MKLLTPLLLVGTAAAAKFSDVQAPSLAFAPKKSSLTTSSRVLNLPRGGGDMKSNVATAYMAVQGAHGYISLAAPEVFAEKICKFDLSEDNVGQMAMEFVGSTLLGFVLMAYLATTSTSLDATKITAYGTLPCIYSAARRLLKGSFDTMGYSKVFAWAGVVAPVLLTSCLFLDKFDTDLLCKINLGVPLAMGVLGNLSSDLGLTLQGLSEQDGVSMAMLKWWYDYLILWGALAALLVKGTDAHEAIGYAVLAFSLLVIDANFLRKSNDPLDMENGPNIVFIAINLLTALGLLKGTTGGAEAQ